MYEYIEAFNAYLAKERPAYQCPDVDSILQMLYCCYQQAHGVENEQVRVYYEELYEAAEKAVPGSGEQVIDDACKLCTHLQRNAFREGVTVGFRLYNELYKRLP